MSEEIEKIYQDNFISWVMKRMLESFARPKSFDFLPTQSHIENEG